MGTEVQYKSYLSGYSSTRDLNEDADSIWHRYYEDKLLGAHYCNGFALEQDNGYSEYAREMLKRTMIEHESVFKKQVYELHRLYRTQKNLMDEVQNKGLYRNSIPADMPVLKMPSDGTNMIWQMPQLPAVRNGYTMALNCTNNMNHPLNIFKESSLQSSHFPVESGQHLKDGVQEPKLNKLPRKMFDLHLPADVYTDNEDTIGKGKEITANPSSRFAVLSNRLCSGEPHSSLKLTLGTGDSFNCLEDNHKADLHKQNGFLINSVDDLNEPSGKLSCEAVSDLDYIHLLGPSTQHVENRQQLLPVRSSTRFLSPQLTFCKDRNSGKGSFSDILFANNDEIREPWSFYNNGTVKRSNMSMFSSGLHVEKLPVSSEAAQINSIKCHKVLPPNKTDVWFQKNTSLGIEYSGRGPCLAISENPRSAASGIPSSFLFDPKFDNTYSASQLVSSSPRPLISLSDIEQALPRFSGVARINTPTKRSDDVIQDSNNASEKCWSNGSLRPRSDTSSDPDGKLGREAPVYPDGKLGSSTSYPNGFYHPFRLESNFARPTGLNLNNKDSDSSSRNSECHRAQELLKSSQRTKMFAIDVNLNEALPDGLEDGLSIQHDIGIIAERGKCHTSSETLSWTISKPDCEYAALNKSVWQKELGFSQLIPKTNTVDSVVECKQEDEKGCSTSILQDFPSILQASGNMLSREAQDSLRNTKILGFPIADKINQKAICPPSYPERSAIAVNTVQEKVGSSYIDLSTDMKASSSEKQFPERNLVRTNSTRCSNINLNSTCMDSPCSTEPSPDGPGHRIDMLSSLTKQSGDVKVASGIHLESPVISQVEENAAPLEVCTPSSNIECFLEVLVREAAENIVQMSLDKNSSSNARGLPLPPVPFDTLQWFAEVVSSNSEDARVTSVGNTCTESSDDRLDMFELMTLKLEELKADDCYCRPWEPEKRKEEETGAASLLLSRPRRGQARRRRQRDFQKDILPSIASLSRHEVTEDLKTIGELMKASGKFWQAGSTRRNTRRKGLHSPVRGRRLPRSLAIARAEVDASPRGPQLAHAQSEVDGATMMGWGRTTRRCRRQRCPPACASPLT